MITKNYIKMCEKAEEIQKAWKPKVGDYVWRKYNFFGEEVDKQFWDKDKMEEIIILTYASEIDGYFHATKDGETRIFNSHNEAHKKTCIYLPTQEQLQEMSSLLCNFPCQILTFLNDWIKDNKIHLSEYASMNALLLCYVIQMKYNKVWTGKDWVKK